MPRQAESPARPSGRPSSWYKNVKSQEPTTPSNFPSQPELYHGTGVGQATRLMLLFDDEEDASRTNSFLSGSVAAEGEMIYLRGDES